MIGFFPVLAAAIFVVWLTVLIWGGPVEDVDFDGETSDVSGMGTGP